MNEKVKIYALRTFSSKDKKQQYYIAECITVSKQETPNFIGYNQITVYLTEEQYHTILAKYQPMYEVTLLATLMGNRVSYSLAS